MGKERVNSWKIKYWDEVRSKVATKKTWRHYLYVLESKIDINEDGGRTLFIEICVIIENVGFVGKFH